MEGWNQGREWRAQPKPQMGESGPSSIPESIYESLDERWSQVRQVQDAAYGRRACLSSSPPPVHVPHPRPGGGATATNMDPSRLPMSPNMSRGNPRQIQIERKDNGFGFTLRHFIVYPPEEGCDNGPPITEPMDTIFVKSVKEMGPAVKAGLNIGDRIVSVNGETVSGRSYAQVVQLIQKSRDTLFLVVVPREDDILQVYFSEIAQNPESNRRDGSQPPLGSKPHWPGASVCSSSSRESSPFSSKTSDSTRDSVYGHNRDYPRHSRDVPHLQHDAGEGVPRQFASQSIYGSLSRPPEPHWTQQIQDDKLLQVPETEHVYAVVGGNEPFWGAASSNNSSSSNTIGSGSTWPNTSQGTWPGPANSNNSRESLDSDNSAAAGFNSRPDESLISKIKKDCEMKEEFLKNQTYPAYLSSPPKEVDTSPYGIANLSSTMPPSRVEIIRNASPPRKENTPVAGYQRGRGNNWGGSYDNSYDDAFSRNNFVIVGSRTLHCEPPQVYQPTIPRPPVCVGCYSANAAGTYCGGCHYHAPVCPLCVVAPPIAPCCNMMTMTTPYQPRPPRPSNLPGIQPLQTYGYRGRHEGPTLPHHGHGGNHGPLPHHGHGGNHVAMPHHGHGGNHTHHDGMVASSLMHHGRGYAPHAHRALPPLVTTPVQMHPDPLRTGHKLDPVSVSAIPMGPHPDRETHSKQVVMRKKAFRQDNEEERNLRRISYLQATKEDPMDVEDNLTGDSGLAPTHSIKKLKSIFSEKASENQPPSLPPPPSPRARELKPTEHSPCPPSIQPHTVPDGTMEGYLTCKVAVVDGKKAIDRSWKTVYVILKQSVLYMYKDKKLALANPDDTEEKPVKLNETEVAVADDYTKRKNVFRVKTEGLSEYLFQAEDEELMKNWVQAIDAAAMAVIVDERKDANKLRKLTSFRNRSPTGQSPSNKSRKSSTDTIPPFKEKDKKNWKGKVVKQLKKMGGGSHGPLYPEGGSVGVPLEECPLCPASPDSELDNIPYLVKICCDIVNERGLDIIGIYRVPGNNAAVTYLTDLINKGQEHFQLDDHRWQDVNVVSSLLKSFFRKLPDPLFTMEMYSLFIDASKLEQPAKRLDLLRKLIRDLPEINYETLKYLCAHLCNVVEHSSVNKMEIRNLAIVFGPTLVRTSDDNMVSMVTDMSQQCRIIESILSNNDFFFNDIDEAVINDEEEENNLITGVGNQSLMLANLAKLEDAGKVQSPKNDMSTKDIVTSIISAANRKMLRSAAGSKGKKESLTDFERSEDSRASESRRDSESVLHGALQIASAVPGLIGPMATSEGNSGRDTPDIDFRQFYGRQSSRGSISGDLMGMGNLGKRRGSLPVCQSKRGSICEYSGGAMCESTPVGELCETRMAIMQVATHEVSTQLEDTFTNGEGSEDNQEVVTTGKLSLNVSGVVQNTVSTTCASGSRHSTHDHDDTQTSAKNYTHQDDTRGKNDTHQDDTSGKNDTQQDDTQTNGKSSKFPIETYAGLDAATAERIKKFEAETKAMLTRPVAVGSSFSRSTQELSEHSFQESSTGSTSLRSSTLSARMSGLRGSPLTTSSLASLPRASNSATSLPRASNSVTSLPKASSSVASLPKSSSSANNSVANLPRSRHSLASNSTASLPRASSVSSSGSVRASISSVGSLEPAQPSDHSKIRASISSVGSLEPLQPNDHTKIRASISSAGSLEQPFDFTKLRQEPVQPTQAADPSKCRLTTPDPDPGPLDGGILLQEPYPSDQLYPAMPPERRFLSLSYRTSLPNLPVGSGHCPAACAARRPSLERPDPSADFDTKKIMSNGTLMRLKQRRPDLLMEGGGGTVETIFDCGEERELEHMEDTCSTEKLLSNLTVSFDQKMRLLLDPNYQSSSSSSSPAASRSIQQMVQLSHSSSSSPAAGRSIQQLVQHSSSSSSSSPATSRSLQQVTQQPLSSCSSPVSPVRYPTVPNSAAASHSASPASASLNSSPSRQVLPPDSFPNPLASLSAARNLPLESQQAKMSPENKKELDEARNIAQQVRQSSKKVELRRGGRVDKHTEPVLRQVNCRKERVRRSDSLTKKEKTELNQLKKRDGGEKENKVAKLRDHFERGSGVKAKSTKIDVNKLRKKLSERNNRRIKRRHTVGGTKDFGDGVVNGGRRNGHTAWDRLQPLVTDEELNVDRSLGVWLKRNRPASRRLSLPDSAAVSAALKLPKHMESHV